MRIIRNLSLAPDACKHAVVALGNFDGVHLGHQAILAHAHQLATAQGRPLAAMTFEPHPREFLSGKKERLRIYPFRRKAELLQQAGVDYLFALRFNTAFSQTTAEDFVQQVLHRQLQASHVVTGYNFFFGRGRQGDKDFLTAQANQLGFGYTAHAPVTDAAGETISSSRIRALLQAGNVAQAAKQLGRPYTISNHVTRGDQRGRTLGFPTANLTLSQLFVPHFGVYAVRAHTAEGKTLSAVANLGIRPTYRADAPLLEVHLLDFAGELYGQRLTVELLHFLREEKRFPSKEALQEQLTKDAEHARQWLSQEPPHAQ
jgi:riboflavin kinase/FMN adenylyltransferase